MDAVAGLLDGGRARGAFVLACRMVTPYALRIEDRAPLAVVVPLTDPLHLVHEEPADGEGGSRPVHAVAVGDVALVRGPAPYVVTSAPGTPASVVVHPGQRCAGPHGEPLDGLAALGARSWGAPEGAHTFLTGVYEGPAQVGDRLLRALPRTTVVPAGEWSRPLTTLLATEVLRESAGQQVVLDRALDLLLVSAVREWFGADPSRAPGWWQAQDDPAVGPALTLLHERPEHPWTLDGLAAAVGWSRSGLARRFTRAVGEPPMTYLTRWRLDLAADLLADRSLTLETAARRVGYGSGFALSAAFRRERGVRPRQLRTS